jgi:hypothetical protein
LAKDPAERFPSAAALCRALNECEAAQGWSRDEAEGWWLGQVRQRAVV